MNITSRNNAYRYVILHEQFSRRLIYHYNISFNLFINLLTNQSKN